MCSSRARPRRKRHRRRLPPSSWPPRARAAATRTMRAATAMNPTRKTTRKPTRRKTRQEAQKGQVNQEGHQDRRRQEIGGHAFEEAQDHVSPDIRQVACPCCWAGLGLHVACPCSCVSVSVVGGVGSPTTAGTLLWCLGALCPYDFTVWYV